MEGRHTVGRTVGKMCTECQETREGNSSVCGVEDRRDVPAKTSPRKGLYAMEKG